MYYSALVTHFRLRRTADPLKWLHFELRFKTKHTLPVGIT